MTNGGGDKRESKDVISCVEKTRQVVPIAQQLPEADWRVEMSTEQRVARFGAAFLQPSQNKQRPTAPSVTHQLCTATIVWDRDLGTARFDYDPDGRTM